MAPPALNAFAVTSLVTALLVCLAPLGLVFGLVALWQIPRKGQRGKGLAIAGVSVSGAVLVLAAGLATVADFRVWTLPARDDNGAVTQPGWAPVQSLDVGDCFTPGAWMRERDTPPLGKGGVQVIPCDETHRAEAYATFRLAEQEEFPGREAIAEVAWQRCAELFVDYSVDPEGSGTLQTYYFRPDEVGWDAGRRTVLCWAARPGDAELDGSVRRDESDFDTDQLAFLSAAKPMYVVTAQRPAKSPEQDLAGAKAWAERMATAQAETIQRLEETELAGVERPTERLVAELKTGLPLWRKAADASDADAFLKSLRSVNRHDGAEHVERIRTALGLPASANQR
ncbi:DUF4190 domain-containing protein [Streptomyces ferrugineus]|uniref:DUF4190 domain-containing protein n=2 Tax=Streptomyces ferrugineus TaxID=1413221 RepID=A0A7M2SYK6_9ACTN|nr:DUF4190 domain-containing protein [Streptomyces ferrugineus]